MSSVSQVGKYVVQIREKLNELKQQGDVIGTFRDTPTFRDSINSNVKDITQLAAASKRLLTELREKETPGLDQYEQEYEELNTELRRELPPIVQKLKNSSQDGGAGPGGASTSTMQSSLLDQQVVDGESEQLEELEVQVREILSTMREVNEIFTKTLEELQRQNHMVVGISDTVAESKNAMVKGNEQLERGKQHQKASTRCLLWIFLFVLLVVAGIVIFVVVKYTGKKSPTPSPTPAPTNTSAPTP
ncbi:hypothetical protein TVAG_161630 [Trichomonas vaginalis G3]|uniref:t-SNARE coiled-coil homology domain-containing protein n=1 Tax=Trichomonas vaginalis (strain ATCC PRA-98 / G3) TaxID=412133 RepID=A2EUN6_TRIV3|nr:positive regulation of receptor localization to synapse [Trichomonas vaginalis G3]EAY03624.1 hypothetical protein TVAG_161630 [Trichomonas vaginalis G3]KAI5524719.1 positive regulation of receptor localization to synapse [Trichomonas vaginalis G3]|eukprot:XP_001315847.1 hypothetical protein [Trichomonas vaginalis G3]